MTKPISVFAHEADQAVGRGFTLTEYTLKNGERYNTVALFKTREEADLDLQEEIDGEYLEEGDYGVTELLIHADGSAFDVAGKEVISHLAWQNNQSEDEVKACLKGFYQEENRRIRHEADASADGPSRG